MPTIEDIKADEFLRKCFEHSDCIHQGRTAPVTITSVQLEFYDKDIKEVLEIFNYFLNTAEGPAHPYDPHHVVWSVWCQRNGHSYKIHAKSKVVDNDSFMKDELQIDEHLSELANLV